MRNARAEYGVEPARKIGAVVVVQDPALRLALEGEGAVMALLAKLEPSQVCAIVLFVASLDGTVGVVAFLAGE